MDETRLAEIKARLAAAKEKSRSRVEKWEAIEMLKGYAETDMDWLINENKRLQAELEKAQQCIERLSREKAHLNARLARNRGID